MTEPIEARVVVPEALWQAMNAEDVTSADFLIELRRIADGLEKLTPGARCEERNRGHECALRDRHVGHHVSADGRYHWLDDE